MKIVLATRNPGKVHELAALLADLPIELLSMREVPDAPVVVEDQPTLRENARKKAWALYQHAGLPALADDTALEVDALAGAPGIFSARFAGEEATDETNRALLLQQMQGEANRNARFRTVIALADSDDVVFFEGICRGRILDHERGSQGFGYDAVFVPDGGRRTFAEMLPEEKNAISHRGQALREASAHLRARLGGDRR